MKDKEREFEIFLKEICRIDKIVRDKLGLHIKVYDISRNPSFKFKGERFGRYYHRSRFGVYFIPNKSIWLNGRLKTRYMKNILIHEITHAFFHQIIGIRDSECMESHGREFKEAERYYRKILS